MALHNNPVERKVKKFVDNHPPCGVPKEQIRAIFACGISTGIKLAGVLHHDRPEGTSDFEFQRMLLHAVAAAAETTGMFSDEEIADMVTRAASLTGPLTEKPS